MPIAAADLGPKTAPKRWQVTVNSLQSGPINQL